MVTRYIPPGIYSGRLRDVPDKWDPNWFRQFADNMMQPADVRNAQAGTGIAITQDLGGNGAPIISATGGGGGAPTAAEYLLLNATGATGLTAYRTLAASSVFSLTDGGALAAYTLGVNATAMTAALNLFTSGLQGLTPPSGGGTTNFLRADGSWAVPPGTGGSGTVTTVSVVTANGFSGTVANPTTTPAITLTLGANAVANSQLAQMPTLTVKGNNTGGTANALDLTVAQVNAILPVFTTTLNGLAPLSGGGTTNFLRADGSWTTIGNANMQTMPTLTVKGNNTGGTTTPLDLTMAQLMAILPDYSSTLPGRVPASGIIGNFFLNSSGGFTNVPNGGLANMANNTIKGNNTGGASIPVDLTVAQVNAILPVFTTTLNGLAPLSGGGTTNFLRADGSWAVPPGSGGGGLLAFAGGLTANTTISASVTPTTGGITLASQTMASGSVWRVRASGAVVGVSSAAARNAVITPFWGTTALPTVTSAILISTVQTTGFECEFLIRGTSTTACWTSGYSVDRTASATAYTIDRATSASTAVTAGAQTLDLRFSVSNATPGDIWTINNVTMERLL